MKIAYKNNKFEISAPTWNEEVELTDGSYTTSDIQDYFEYVLRQNMEKILLTVQYEYT